MYSLFLLNSFILFKIWACHRSHGSYLVTMQQVTQVTSARKHDQNGTSQREEKPVSVSASPLYKQQPCVNSPVLQITSHLFYLCLRCHCQLQQLSDYLQPCEIFLKTTLVLYVHVCVHICIGIRMSAEARGGYCMSSSIALFLMHLR